MTSVTYFYDVDLPNDFSATIQILRTGRAMVERGTAFTLAAGRSDETSGPFDAMGIAPHPSLGIRRAFPAWPRHPGLRRFVSRKLIAAGRIGADSDVVMSRGETAFVLAPVARQRRQPFVLEVHRMLALGRAEAELGRTLAPGEKLGRKFAGIERAERHAFSSASGVVFLNEAVRRACERRFGSVARSIVAPSGVDVGKRQRPAEKTVDVVYVGKIERRKGVDLAIEAMVHLPGRRLRVIGGGAFLDEAKALASALDVGDRVEFAGRLAHAQVARELRAARVGLCPLPKGIDSVSDEFTSPLKLLEMMACELPVVATDLASVRAVCRNGRDALLVPPNCAKSIAAAIGRILDDADLSARLRAAAWERARDFSWERRAACIADFLQAVHSAEIGGNGARS